MIETRDLESAGAMLHECAGFDWDAEAQPPWNADDEIVSALHALASATPATGQQTYSRILYAVGNNHAGTYFPVVLAVVPFLGEILEGGGSVARARTLDVLIDLVASFEPESGHALVETSDGPQQLTERLRGEVIKLANTVEHISASADAEEESRLARELLDLIR